MLSGLSGHNIIFYPFVRVFNVNWAHKLRAGLEFVSHSVWKEQNRYDIWPAYMWSKDWRHMHKRVHTSTTHLEIKAMRWYSNLPTTELFTKERAVDSWIVGFNIIWQMIRLLLIRLLHFLFLFLFRQLFPPANLLFRLVKYQYCDYRAEAFAKPSNNFQLPTETASFKQQQFIVKLCEMVSEFVRL